MLMKMMGWVVSDAADMPFRFDMHSTMARRKKNGYEEEKNRKTLIHK